MTGYFWTRNGQDRQDRLRSGLTLTEVLVGACIFALAVSGISGALRQGSRMILDANNKKIAYTNAQSVLERYLTFSYEGLRSEPSSAIDISTGCQVDIAEDTMEAGLRGRSDVPYCTIQVSCVYDDPAKTVSLYGIIPYPHLGVYTAEASSNTPATSTGQIILSYLLAPAPRVSSDLLVYYNIVFEVVDNAVPLNGTEFIYTQAELNNSSGSGSIGMETASPVLTQPTISNNFIVGRDLLDVNGANTITISWKRTGAGGVILPRRVNLIIIRIENNINND